MKKLINILFLTIFTLVACTEELGTVNEGKEDGILLKLYNSQLTKAIDDTQGSEYERSLKRLDCFFYIKGQTNQPCVYYSNVVLNQVGQAEVSIYVDESVINDIFPNGNTCDIFVIANIPGNPTFTAGGADTDVETLGKTLLNRETAGYDEIGSPFVMAGLAEGRRDSKKNAEATIGLVRAAAKLTFSVMVPGWIDVTEGNTVRRYKPVLVDQEQNLTLKAAFHNGAKKGYLYDEYALQESDLYVTEDLSFDLIDTITAEQPEDLGASAIPDTLVYSCEVPLYSYSRDWDKGAHDAAYWTFELPWGYDSTLDGQIDMFQRYFYQILVNGAKRSIEPNHWYDMTVKVGVLGSTVENLPRPLETMSYYVLDWTEEDDEISGDRHENVEIQNYQYLSVENPLLEMHNTISGEIRFTASHDIGVIWDDDEIRTVAGISGIESHAFYINNGGVEPTIKNLAVDLANDFKLADKKDGILIFTKALPADCFSPAYLYIKIFLDVNRNKRLDADTEEANFVVPVRIIIYPPMYVERDESTLRSIYVNGRISSLTPNGFGQTTSIGSHGLGNYDGVRNHYDSELEGTPNNRTVNYPMYVITVSSFTENNTFSSPSANENGYLDIAKLANYTYIIGDPRQRSSDTELDNGENAVVTNLWYGASSNNFGDAWGISGVVDGNTQYVKRSLQNYYPTNSYGEAFRVIAPKYRIVSFNNASGANCDAEGAAMRCASLQEDGFPAGRWRLPTIAEIQFIVYLQGKKAIQPIFTSTNSNYATAAYASNGNLVTIQARDAGSTQLEDNNPHNDVTWGAADGRISVRCVYDEWYWGSQRDAKKKDKPSELVTDYKGEQEYRDEYEFTWGDKFIY